MRTIELYRQTGTTVAHNPECNMKVADGIAPITKMVEAGVVVSLGTDSCSVNDNMDMFEVMRMAAFLQKVTAMDPAVLPAATNPAYGHAGRGPKRWVWRTKSVRWKSAKKRT